MLLDNVVNILENTGNFSSIGTCVDCGKSVTVDFGTTQDGEISISGGAVFAPEERFGYQEKYLFKCDECFKVDNKIHQLNEVFTRCVGYYRPKSQMNNGRISEINARKMFNIPAAV